MLSLEQLNIFVTVANSGSFSAAARKLGKVQSAVSQSIANTEIDLGLELFDRSSRIPGLTPQGKRLLRYAEAVMDQHQSLICAAQSYANENRRSFTLAMDKSLTCCDLVPFFQDFEKRYPQISLEIQSCLSMEIPNLVSSGKVDLGYRIMDGQYTPGLVANSVQLQAFMPVCSHKHPLSQLEAPSKSDLMNYRQIQIREGEDCGVANLVPASPNVWWTNDERTLLSMVKAGCGWSFLSHNLALKEIREGTLIALNSPFNNIPFTLNIERIVSEGHQDNLMTQWVTQVLEPLLGIDNQALKNLKPSKKQTYVTPKTST